MSLLALSGCLFRSHQVEKRVVSGVPLKEATLADLVSHINAEAAKVQTLNATVDIATDVGGSKKGKVTQYQEIRGYVLVRKPGMLRMIGLFPVVRNKAFDMVSDGEHFKLSIPTRGQFIVGSKDVVRPSPNPLVNLRPQHIMDAILIREVDPRTEIAFLEAGTETVADEKTKKYIEQPTYIVNVIHHDVDGEWRLNRRVVFSRTDLFPRRQFIYDKGGNVATIATYESFKEYDAVQFPDVINIERPQEEYNIRLTVVKMKMNDPLRDDQFVLTQPGGSKLVDIDKGPIPAEKAEATAPSKK